MSDIKKQQGADKKAEREKAKQTLAALSVVAISSMNKKQMDEYLIALGQVAGIVTERGVVK